MKITKYVYTYARPYVCDTCTSHIYYSQITVLAAAPFSLCLLYFSSSSIIILSNATQSVSYDNEIYLYLI